MEYRNDLEASRLRINTLEAKLEETKAALNAREAELMECRVERDRLRQAGASKEPRRRWPLVVAGAVALNIAAFIGFAVGTFVGAGSHPHAQPAAAQPATTYKERSSAVEGTIHLPPPPPPVPPAIVSGQIDKEPEEAKTIETVIEEARPKVQECYREEAKAHANAKGSVSVKFDIEASRKVSNIKLETLPYIDPWWSKTFETCVVGVYSKLDFPNDTGTKVTARGSYFLSSFDLGI